MATDVPSSGFDENAPTVSLHPHAAVAAAASDGPMVPADLIKGFVIEGRLGEGGMGVVYRARQERPGREVALKIIRLSAVTPTSLRRFERETEILAKLQHPCIAAIYEAGTAATAVGVQPYFAMELVEGEPLMKYAAGRNLSLRERLKLLAQIADAVHYAHQKGIIHRDLKPANILVKAPAAEGELSQPKILDFGLAVTTDAEAQITSMQTEVGTILGTLSYMAPEQATGDPDQIDTRTDVYALGVIAYELLTGQLPHNLANRAVFAALRIIQTEEPSRLSSINKTLRGDVDVIVSKALEKEKPRRYQSASDFAADIRRHLEDQPIAARRASTWYQATKFAKRNKMLVGATFVVMLTLIGGIIMTSEQARVAQCNANEAEAALKQVQQEREVAEKNLRRLRDEQRMADERRFILDAGSTSGMMDLQGIKPVMATLTTQSAIQLGANGGVDLHAPVSK